MIVTNQRDASLLESEMRKFWQIQVFAEDTRKNTMKAHHNLSSLDSIDFNLVFEADLRDVKTAFGDATRMSVQRYNWTNWIR